MHNQYIFYFFLFASLFMSAKFTVFFLSCMLTENQRIFMDKHGYTVFHFLISIAVTATVYGYIG